jgi:uncharacterized protein
MSHALDPPGPSDTHELPMFPLGSVLLPGMVLPLHVFEPRFRVLVDTVLLSDRREFGVVLIERGSEVGGGEVRTDVGCTARVLDVARAEDGRVALVALGAERIRVERWMEDDPFPRAIVRRWPDEVATPDAAARGAEPADTDAPDPGADLAAVEATLGRLLELVGRLGLSEDVALPELSDDPTERLYQIATLSPLGALDRQRVLCAPGLADRLATLGELLIDQEILLRAEVDRREE